MAVWSKSQREKMVRGKLVFPNARETGLGEKCQQFVGPEVRTVGERGLFPIWDVFYKAKVCFLRGGVAVGLKRAPVPGEVIIDEVSNAVSAVELPVYSFVKAWPANGVVCKVVLVLNESKGKTAATVLTENVVFPGSTSESKIKRRKSPYAQSCPRVSRWAQTKNVVGLLTKIVVDAVYSRKGGVVLYRGGAFCSSGETG